MTDGLVAALIKSRKGLLFEGKHTVAIVSPSPAAPGHVWVLPREPFTILENTPDFVVAELFVVANRVSMALFDGLGAQGTNVLVQNGTGAGQVLPHLIVHVIPRQEDDGLKLLWEPKQLDEEAMSTVELKLKDEMKGVGLFEKEKPKPVEQPKAAEIRQDDLKVRHLRRIP